MTLTLDDEVLVVKAARALRKCEDLGDRYERMAALHGDYACRPLLDMLATKGTRFEAIVSRAVANERVRRVRGIRMLT